MFNLKEAGDTHLSELQMCFGRPEWNNYCLHPSLICCCCKKLAVTTKAADKLKKSKNCDVKLHCRTLEN